MKFRHYREGLFVVLLLVSVVLVGWITLPLAMPLLWAGIFALLLAPLVERAAQRVPRWVAALGGTIGVTLLGVVPLTIIAALALQEAMAVYTTLVGENAQQASSAEGIVGSLLVLVAPWLAPYGITQADLVARLGDAFAGAASFVLSGLVAAGQFTFSFLLQTAVMLYLLFFLLKDGRRFVAWLIETLPLGDRYERRIFAEFAKTTRAVMKGTVLVALIQGLIGGLAFWLGGVPAPVLWGIAMTFFALIPSIGPAIVWLPVGVGLALMGQWVSALIVLGVGVGVISVVDNVLRPLLVGRDTGLPDPVIFLATLGGIATFGISGFVLGPLAFALAHVMIQAFREMYHDDLTHNA